MDKKYGHIKIANPLLMNMHADRIILDAFRKSPLTRPERMIKDYTGGMTGAVGAAARQLIDTKGNPVKILKEVKTGNIPYKAKDAEPNPLRRSGYNIAAGLINIPGKAVTTYGFTHGAGSHGTDAVKWLFDPHGGGAALDVASDYATHYKNKIVKKIADAPERKTTFRDLMSARNYESAGQDIGWLKQSAYNAFIDELEKIAISRRAIKHIAHGTAAAAIAAHVAVEMRNKKKYKK